MKKHYHRLFIIVIVSLCTACSLPNNQQTSDLSNSDPNNNSQATLEEVLQAQHLLAIIKDNHITLVDPNTSKTHSLYKLKPEEFPASHNLLNIQLSPSHDYLVWYSPQIGFLNLKIGDTSPQIITASSQWLNTNPYFSFHHVKNLMYYVDSEGTELVTADLSTNTVSSITIPYPFGNQFRISPDDQHVLFISGFDQTQNQPQYMFTAINGTDPVRFTTETTLNKRHLVTWLPDSSGIITVHGSNQLIFVPINNPTTNELFFTKEVIGDITDLLRIDNQIFVFADSRWHVINTDTRQEVGRIPLEIAEEIHRPKFVPWHNNQILIEETMRLEPDQYNRLWLSNYIGIKNKIVDSYHEIVIENITPQI